MRFLGDFSRPSERSRSLRLATLAAVLAGALAVAGSEVGGPLVWILALVVIPAGSAVSYVRRDSTGPLVPTVLTVVTVALVARFAVTYADVSNPGELRVPLAELLLTLEAVRSFSLRSRRDLRFALASSLALISVAAALALSIGFAAYAAAWVAAAVLALTLAHRSELAELAGPRPVGRTAPVPARAIVTALMAVAAVATAAFLVIPAARSSRFLAVTSKLPHQLSVPSPGGLSNPSLGPDDPSGQGGDPSTGGGRTGFGYFGFANSLDTSVRGRPDDTLVMRVRATAPDFWRGQTFDRWDGRSWTQSDQRTLTVRGANAIQLVDPLNEPPVQGPELVQTFYLETSGPNLIFAANRPTLVYIPQSTLFELSDGTVRTGVELDRGAIYTVVSRREQVTAARLRATADMSRTLTPFPLLQRYTDLPDTPARVRALAASVTAGRATTYDKVLALEEWMGRNTRYALDIPPLPPGEDAVERFLFVDRVGFCEQIGSSLVVMLRSLGIPARLAVGYAPGERNPFTGLFEVRARDAHAWAEVYFPGLGWQAFDPTAEVPLAGEAPPDAARVGLRAYLGRHLPHLSAPVLAAIAAILAALGAFLWRDPLRMLARRMRRRGPRPWSERQLERLEAVGRERGRGRLEGETAREYADALRRTVFRDPRIEEIADALDADAFSADPLPPTERERVEAMIGALAAD